jgi:hypothetical protein
MSVPPEEAGEQSEKYFRGLKELKENHDKQSKDFQFGVIRKRLQLGLKLTPEQREQWERFQELKRRVKAEANVSQNGSNNGSRVSAPSGS